MIFAEMGLGSLLLFAAQASDFMWSESAINFEARPAFEETYVRVDIGRLRSQRDQREFWFKRSEIDRTTGDVSQVRWTDTVRCEKAHNILESLHGVEPPRVSIPGYDVSPGGGIVVTADGTSYSLEARAHYSGVVGSYLYFNSNVGTPLAKWVDGSLEVLAPCWSEEEPKPTTE